MISGGYSKAPVALYHQFDCADSPTDRATDSRLENGWFETSDTFRTSANYCNGRLSYVKETSWMAQVTVMPTYPVHLHTKDTG